MTTKIMIRIDSLEVYDSFHAFYLYGVGHNSGEAICLGCLGCEQYVGDPNDDPDLAEAYGFQLRGGGNDN